MASIEHQIQSRFFKHLEHLSEKTPALKYAYAIPNGGPRHFHFAVKLKREGVKAGVPDVFVPIPTKKYHGLYLEFKTPKGKVSDRQKEYMEYLESVKYKCAVVRSVEEAVETLLKYLNNKL